MLAVGPDFFETMRIPLLRGRTFQPADLRSTHLAVVVNQAFVEVVLHSRDPIGLRFEQDKRELEIVGVVANTKYEDLRKAMLPTAFIPLANSSGTFELRSVMPSSVLIPLVKSTVTKLDENLPVYSVRTQSQTIDRLLFNERLLARLGSLFGLLALGLACIGVYGLLAYGVAQRTREFGVRMALGAQRNSVLSLVLRQGLALALVGVAIGIAISAAFARYLQSLLFGVSAVDPFTFAAISLLLLLVAALACYLPARRAMLVDPQVALRYE
jgi:predicted permease